MVLVSSDAEELIEGSDRVVVLRDGAVAGMLRGDEVTTEHLMNVIATAQIVSRQAPAIKGGTHALVSGRSSMAASTRRFLDRVICRSLKIFQASKFAPKLFDRR